MCKTQWNTKKIGKTKIQNNLVPNPTNDDSFCKQWLKYHSTHLQIIRIEWKTKRNETFFLNLLGIYLVDSNNHQRPVLFCERPALLREKKTHLKLLIRFFSLSSLLCDYFQSHFHANFIQESFVLGFHWIVVVTAFNVRICFTSLDPFINTFDVLTYEQRKKKEKNHLDQEKKFGFSS